jgi:hypothetical protein
MNQGITTAPMGGLNRDRTNTQFQVNVFNGRHDGGDAGRYT